MANVNLNTVNATVIGIREFQTRQGLGADFSIEAKADTCTVYMEIPVYDAQARTALAQIHKGDTVDVTGTLRCKLYTKKDGTPGFSLIVDNVQRFEKNAETASQNPQAEGAGETPHSDPATQNPQDDRSGGSHPSWRYPYASPENEEDLPF